MRPSPEGNVSWHMGECTQHEGMHSNDIHIYAFGATEEMIVRRAIDRDIFLP